VRVLHAADFGGVAPGGFVPLIAALARRLRERGDAFALAVPEVEGATWHQLVRDAGAELHAVHGGAEAATFARAWRPDVAHVHFFGWELAVTARLWTARTRMFWHAHSTSMRDGSVRRSAKSVLKYRVAGARVERFIAVSQTIADEIIALGAPRKRVVVVPNAIDGTRFRPPSSEQRTAARAALGLGVGPAILFFGRDPQLKGADVLLDALAQMRSAAVRGTTAGIDTVSEATAAGVTVVCVATPDAVRASFAPHARVIDVQRTDDVVPLLWAADVLAIPSRGEGAPFVVLEALATGLPIAASDIAALREAAGTSNASAFAAVGDAHGLAVALQTALAHGRATDGSADAMNGPETWAAAIDALYRRS
jgi:glycosyltransferase involved in cell wall biosynthesis